MYSFDHRHAAFSNNCYQPTVQKNQIQNKHRKLPKNAERRSNRPAAAKDLTSMVANRKLPLSTDAPC